MLFSIAVNETETIAVPLVDKRDYCNRYCINVSSRSFILAIPNSPRDILCPIYIEPDNNYCYNISRCKDLSETFRFPFFSICRHAADDTIFEMCFTNITYQLSGLKLFFIISGRPCLTRALDPSLVWSYVRVIEIQAESKYSYIV